MCTIKLRNMALKSCWQSVWPILILYVPSGVEITAGPPVFAGSFSFGPAAFWHCRTNGPTAFGRLRYRKTWGFSSCNLRFPLWFKEGTSRDGKRGLNSISEHLLAIQYALRHYPRTPPPPPPPRCSTVQQRTKDVQLVRCWHPPSWGERACFGVRKLVVIIIITW